jgi:hypothetical protein
VAWGQPLGVDPDGRARWLVRVRFVDAAGAPTVLLRGGDVAFAASDGTAQWQTRARFGGPAAIVSTARDGPLAVTVRFAVGPRLAPLHLVTDTRSWHVRRVAAAALGPHEVRLGWFPPSSSPARVVRTGDGPAIAFAAPPGGTFRDDGVRPGATYRYRLAVAGRPQATLRVDVPPEVRGDRRALGGLGMWLSFSPSLDDDDSYATLDPVAIAALARRNRLRKIELRTSYGPFWEIAPQARPFVDALLDAAAARGVAVLAWCVPRSPEFDDLALAVRAARYRTARGNGFAGLAVDLERGDAFAGTGAAAYAALASEVPALRAALGPHYPLLATVEDPYLEHLGAADVPYAAIAAAADAVQPMTYWRMLGPGARDPASVRRTVRASVAALRRAVGRPVAIDLGAQTAGGGDRGAPRPAELAAAIGEARALGLAGVTFFAWRSTTEAQWRAIGTAAVDKSS